MIDLVAAFEAVVDAMGAIGAEYVVVGSTAAAGWGVARATRDVDVVAIMSVGDVHELLKALDREALYVPDDDAHRAALTGGSFNVLHTRSGGKVDVFVAQHSDEFTRSRLRRRVPADVLGVSSWIATAEDVILAKLRWRLVSRSEIQWRDCVEVAATQDLDRAYMWSWAAELGVAEDLAELLDGRSAGAGQPG